MQSKEAGQRWSPGRPKPEAYKGVQKRTKGGMEDCTAPLSSFQLPIDETNPYQPRWVAALTRSGQERRLLSSELPPLHIYAFVPLIRYRSAQPKQRYKYKSLFPGVAFLYCVPHALYTDASRPLLLSVYRILQDPQPNRLRRELALLASEQLQDRSARLTNYEHLRFGQQALITEGPYLGMEVTILPLTEQPSKQAARHQGVIPWKKTSSTKKTGSTKTKIAVTIHTLGQTVQMLISPNHLEPIHEVGEIPATGKIGKIGKNDAYPSSPWTHQPPQIPEDVEVLQAPHTPTYQTTTEQPTK